MNDNPNNTFFEVLRETLVEAVDIAIAEARSGMGGGMIDKAEGRSLKAEMEAETKPAEKRRVGAPRKKGSLTARVWAAAQRLKEFTSAELGTAFGGEDAEAGRRARSLLSVLVADGKVEVMDGWEGKRPTRYCLAGRRPPGGGFQVESLKSKVGEAEGEEEGTARREPRPTSDDYEKRKAELGIVIKKAETF